MKLRDSIPSSGSDYDSVLFNSASYTPSILVNVTLNWHGRTQRVVRDHSLMTSTNRLFICPSAK